MAGAGYATVEAYRSHCHAAIVPSLSLAEQELPIDGCEAAGRRDAQAAPAAAATANATANDVGSPFATGLSAAQAPSSCSYVSTLRQDSTRAPPSH